MLIENFRLFPVGGTGSHKFVYTSPPLQYANKWNNYSKLLVQCTMNRDTFTADIHLLALHIYCRHKFVCTTPPLRYANKWNNYLKLLVQCSMTIDTYTADIHLFALPHLCSSQINGITTQSYLYSVQ